MTKLPDVDVQAIYDRFEEGGVLEDRQEYTREDLAKSEQLTDEDADDLYYLIQRDIDPKRESPYGMEDRFPPKLVVESITEALHQGLDGWTPRQRVAIERFLDDLALAVKLSQKDMGY